MQRRDTRGRYAKKGNSTFALLGGIAMIIFIAIVIKDAGTETYNAPMASSTPEVVEVQPDWASDEDAVEAAKKVIRTKELEAQKNVLEGEIEALKAQYEADLAAKQSELDVIKEELSF